MGTYQRATHERDLERQFLARNIHQLIRARGARRLEIGIPTGTFFLADLWTKTHNIMAKYGRAAEKSVEEAMHERKRGELRMGRSNKKVTSRKQAIAIGLSEARKKGAKVPPAKKSASARNRPAKKRAATKRKKTTRKQSR